MTTRDAVMRASVRANEGASNSGSVRPIQPMRPVRLVRKARYRIRGIMQRRVSRLAPFVLLLSPGCTV